MQKIHAFGLLRTLWNNLLSASEAAVDIHFRAPWLKPQPVRVSTRPSHPPGQAPSTGHYQR